MNNSGLVDLGVELGKRQRIAKENIRQAKSRGYENYYRWQYKEKDEPFGRTVNLFTKSESQLESDEELSTGMEG